MSEQEEEIVEYTVVLVFPGFGEERENAEQVVEGALEYLNIPHYEPGMRFAPHVRAHLEIVMGVQQALDLLEANDDIATMLIHDLDDDERMYLSEECASRGVTRVYSMESRGRPRKPRPKDPKGGISFQLRPRTGKGPHAHQIPDTTLTEPINNEEDWNQRVGQVIMVLALGVMEVHFNRHPSPIRRYLKELEEKKNDSRGV